MSLVLDSLEIKNFRAFKHLRIEKLGRVNLIVGKNNVGKSSVLEALWLYATKGDPNVVMQLLRERDELKDAEGQESTSASFKNVSALKHLFYGRKDIPVQSDQILIGSSAVGRDTIAIGVAPYERSNSGNGYAVLRPVEVTGDVFTANLVPSITIDIGEDTHMHFPLDQNYKSEHPGYRPVKVVEMVVRSVMVADDGLSANDVAAYWDNIVLSDLQDEIIIALKIIAPDVVGINLKGGGSDRIPIVKVGQFDAPIPLRSLGDGMNRMFGIALALVNAKDGMLLIDEVDTGLHYSVLPDLWKLIFEVAHRLNVQVFATSHSWDCIQAFQLAAEENQEEEGVLVRLENRKAGIGAVTFDEMELAIVTREQIEVR